MEVFWEVLKSILLGVVQGITEWLPISSTGHMLLLDEFIQLQGSKSFVDTFMVLTQLGSIFAVIVLYFSKLNPFYLRSRAGNAGTSDYRLGGIGMRRETMSMWGKVLIASIPAGIIGLLFDDRITEWFYNAVTIAITLIFYGILFLVIETRRRKPKIRTLAQMDYRTVIWIGVFQMLALIPGTSRSGATIVGAVLLGCSRYIAAEFSFFLAVPAMLGASGYKLLKAGFAFSTTEWIVLLVGMVVAFLVSVVAIKFLMGYIKKHDFKVFGYYRIVLGVIVLAYFGVQAWLA